MIRVNKNEANAGSHRVLNGLYCKGDVCLCVESECEDKRGEKIVGAIPSSHAPTNNCLIDCRSMHTKRTHTPVQIHTEQLIRFVPCFCLLGREEERGKKRTTAEMQTAKLVG